MLKSGFLKTEMAAICVGAIVFSQFGHAEGQPDTKCAAGQVCKFAVPSTVSFLKVQLWGAGGGGGSGSTSMRSRDGSGGGGGGNAAAILSTKADPKYGTAGFSSICFLVGRKGQPGNDGGDSYVFLPATPDGDCGKSAPTRESRNFLLAALGGSKGENGGTGGTKSGGAGGGASTGLQFKLGAHVLTLATVGNQGGDNGKVGPHDSNGIPNNRSLGKLASCKNGDYCGGFGGGGGNGGSGGSSGCDKCGVKPGDLWVAFTPGGGGGAGSNAQQGAEGADGLVLFEW